MLTNLSAFNIIDNYDLEYLNVLLNRDLEDRNFDSLIFVDEQKVCRNCGR